MSGRILLALALMVMLSITPLASAMSYAEEEKFAHWMFYEDQTSHHVYNKYTYNCISFALDLIKNSTKGGFGDKVYLAQLYNSQFFPEGHAVAATRTDVTQTWHLWEPNFKGEEAMMHFSDVLSQQSSPTLVTIFNSDLITRIAINTFIEDPSEMMAKFYIYPQKNPVQENHVLIPKNILTSCWYTERILTRWWHILLPMDTVISLHPILLVSIFSQK